MTQASATSPWVIILYIKEKTKKPGPDNLDPFAATAIAGCLILLLENSNLSFIHAADVVRLHELDLKAIMFCMFNQVEKILKDYRQTDNLVPNSSNLE